MNYESVINYSTFDFKTAVLIGIIIVLLIFIDFLLLTIFDLKNKRFLEVISPLTYVLIGSLLIYKICYTETNVIPKPYEDSKTIEAFYNDQLIGLSFFDIGYEYNDDFNRNLIELKSIKTNIIKYDDKEFILGNKMSSVFNYNEDEKNYGTKLLIDLSYKNGENSIKTIDIYDINNNYLSSMKFRVNSEFISAENFVK